VQLDIVPYTVHVDHIRSNCTYQRPLYTTYGYKHNSTLNTIPICRNFCQTSRHICGSHSEYKFL